MPDRFVGSRATKDILRPNSPFLSSLPSLHPFVPPSLSTLSMLAPFQTFCSPPCLTAGVNTLFCDCILIYVAFSKARVVLQRVWSKSCYIAKQENEPLYALRISIRMTILFLPQADTPTPLIILLISPTTCSTPAISLWVMAGLLTTNMGLLIRLQGPNQSFYALIVVAPNGSLVSWVLLGLVFLWSWIS